VDFGRLYAFSKLEPRVPIFDVSIIVVSYNTKELLPRFFSSLDVAISASPALTFEIIVVDNASSDGSSEVIKLLAPRATLLVNTLNVGFGRANNQALEVSSGRFILLLNTDAFIESGTIQEAVAYLEENSSIGVLGAKLIGEDHTLQPSCRYFPSPLRLFSTRFALHRIFPRMSLLDDLNWNHATERICDWVPGCFYLVKRIVVENVGLFDPRYFLYYEEVDHCREVQKAGWQIAYFPFVTVIHLGGESAKSAGTLNQVSKQLTALQVESEMLYIRKQFGLFGLLGHAFLLFIAIVVGLIKVSIQSPTTASKQDFRHSRKLLLAEWSIAMSAIIGTRLGRKPTR
jgi:N-acetylglucosaminyl-diphospho-decaprenol L-rhamnosyltransferase